MRELASIYQRDEFSVSLEAGRRVARSPCGNFLREITRHPAAVGAIAPTLRRAARELVSHCEVRTSARTIELGAGTGAITSEILRQKPASGRVLAIERHPAFAAGLRARFPEVQVAESCGSRLGEVLGALGFPEADRIVSTLPWGNFEAGLQARILGQAHDALAEGGIFGTLVCFGSQWLPAGRRFRRLLGEIFTHVEVRGVVWRNVPPAMIYVARRGNPPSRKDT